MLKAMSAALALLVAFYASVGASLAGGDSRDSRSERKVFISVENVRKCSNVERSFESLWWLEPADNDFDRGIGCASRSNLAAMIASRRDLVRGRGTLYSDGDRAAHTVTQYRLGKPAHGEAKEKPGSVNGNAADPAAAKAVNAQ